jgi:hypothetical protein
MHTRLPSQPVRRAIADLVPDIAAAIDDACEYRCEHYDCNECNRERHETGDDDALCEDHTNDKAAAVSYAETLDKLRELTADTDDSQPLIPATANHAEILGTGAALTEHAPLYLRQQQALGAAADVMPAEIGHAPRAIAEAAVRTYLAAMRTSEPQPTDGVTLADGTAVTFEPSGIALSIGRRDEERGRGLFVQIDTDGLDAEDTSKDAAPKVAVFVNDATIFDDRGRGNIAPRIGREIEVWVVQHDDDGPAAFEREEDADEYAAARGQGWLPEEILVCNEETAQAMIAEARGDDDEE